MSGIKSTRTWQEIAAEAYKEQDTQKLLDLTAELEHALGERDEKKPPQKAAEGDLWKLPSNRRNV